jgi:hypothetical protein
VHTIPIAQKVDVVILQVDVDGRIKEMRRAILYLTKFINTTHHKVTGRRLRERQQLVQRVLTTNAIG